MERIAFFLDYISVVQLCRTFSPPADNEKIILKLDFTEKQLHCLLSIVSVCFHVFCSQNDLDSVKFCNSFKSK